MDLDEMRRSSVAGEDATDNNSEIRLTSTSAYNVVLCPLMDCFELKEPMATKALRYGLLEAEKEQAGFLHNLIKNLISKSGLNNSVNESFLRLHACAPSEDLRIVNGGAVVQEVSQRAAILRSILGRIPEEIADRRTFLETIKEIANSIRKLLDAVNSLIPLLLPELQPTIYHRKREFVRYSKKFTNTLKDYFKGDSAESVFYSADQLVCQIIILIRVIREKIIV